MLATDYGLPDYVKILLQLFRKMLHHRRNRIGGHLAEAADGGTAHRVRQFRDGVQILPAKSPGEQIADHFHEFLRPHAARDTFPTRLIAIELHAVQGILDKIAAVAEDDKS